MQRAALVVGIAAALTALVAGACGNHRGGGEGGDAGLSPLEATPPALIPPSAQTDTSSAPIVFDTLRGGVWTANGDVGTISYVDVDHYKVLAETAVGGDVRSVALSPDKAWVAAVDRAGGNVALVDAYTNTVARTIPVGIHPRAAVWNAADPRWLYVALEGSDAVAVVDRTLGLLSETIPVGRMPSGLAVSQLRNELYVTHRIDPFVSIVDLGRGAVVDEVPLAPQPAQSDRTVPQGAPFAFEGMSWTPVPDMSLHNQGGDVVWVPHELIAPTHPFQFQTTVFPAISVVDLSQRAEVVTNPNTGVTSGRKLLFDAIDILDPQGNPMIVSQPCAVTQHANAIAVYALACGSEDLITFDATQGVAVSILRDLPGDHPVGLTLDDTGQRLFIVSDQSHTLLGYDTANGSVVDDLRLIGGPLSLIAKDPLDPQLRAGQTLFFSANGLARNAYAVTGDNWLSCGACHLDGFGGGEETLFDNAHPANPAENAQIGHTGLVDLFSTAPNPTAPTFNPHDIVVALLEQGGLAPDRTGISRTGAVNPASPPAGAVAMATQLAYVVARDLPSGPSWLLSNGMPNAMNDTAFCGQCHSREYAAWQQSAHAHAAADPMVRYCAGLEGQIVGVPFTRFCAGCHDPVSARTGDATLSLGRGVTCLGCHEVDYPTRAEGNAGLSATAYDWTVSHVTRAQASLATLRQPEFCGGCHEQFVPGTGLRMIDTLTVWKGSRFAGPQTLFPDGGLADLDAAFPDGANVEALDGGAPVTPTTSDAAADAGVAGDGGDGGDATPPQYDVPAEGGPPPVDAGVTPCVTCHMPLSGTYADHRFIGGNVYLSEALGDGGTVPALTANLGKALVVAGIKVTGGYLVTVTNVGAGHDFPNGVPDIREAWIEVDAKDASGNLLLRIGGPDASNLIPPGAARFGEDIAGPDGGILYRHELSQALSVPFERRVPPGGSVDVFVPAPASLPQGTSELDAVMYVRSVRTTYYRAATGDDTGTAPELAIATGVVH